MCGCMGGYACTYVCIRTSIKPSTSVRGMIHLHTPLLIFPYHNFFLTNLSFLHTTISKSVVLVILNVVSYLIVWLAPRAGRMNQIGRCDWLPERARWGHLARSGLPAVSRKISLKAIQ